MCGAVALASLLPPRGGWAPAAGIAADAGIVLLFFLHGARLSREAILAGAGHWRLHLAVFAATFLLFPLLGLGIARLPFLEPWMAAGLLFLTLLPSTVQSSIAFTSMARGNVAAALCSASFSNLVGILLTPVLVALLMQDVAGGSQGGVPLGAIRTVALQLLLPFVLGHLLRPLIGGWVTRHKSAVTIVDRGSILLVVYTAFGAAVVEGLWQRVSAPDLLLLLGICLILLAIILSATWSAGRLLGLRREDRIVLLFCGSKKGLVTGVPMAGVLFPAAQVGPILLPLILFHQIQLVACAIIARRIGREEDAAS